MPTTRLHRSPWQAATKRTPVHPRLVGDVDVDIAVVGGGLTGVLCATRLAKAGASVALVEGDLVGSGSTGGSLGLVEAGPGVALSVLRERGDLREAKAVWSESRQAAAGLVAQLRRRRIRCDLAAVPRLDLALDAQAAERWRRERDALDAARLEVGWLEGARLARAVGHPAVAALRHADAWTLDPVRAVVGLAADLARSGALVFERSEVRRVKAEADGLRLVSARGTVWATEVVVATGIAAPGFAPIARHARWVDVYFVEVPVADEVRGLFGDGRAAVRDSHPSGHVWRWTPAGTLVFGGASQPSVPDRQADRQVRQRAGQLMYELSLLYPEVSGVAPVAAWRVRTAVSGDGLPLVGRHRAFPRHLFALATGGGLQWAALAADTVARAWRNRPKAADTWFSFPRG